MFIQMIKIIIRLNIKGIWCQLFFLTIMNMRWWYDTILDLFSNLMHSNIMAQLNTILIEHQVKYRAFINKMLVIRK
jgi:hypothetical protein